MKNVSLKSGCLLFLAAFIWGVAFVAQSVGMEYMGPFSFNGIRFLMGSAVLAPMVFVRRWKRGKADGQGKSERAEEIGSQKEGSRQKKATVLGGICCGLALCAASSCQQIGIQYTTVGKAGFITALYIVIVPILGIFLKKKVPGRGWAGALLAVVGMYLLCMSERLALSRGDAYIFACAILFSVHILVIDHFSPHADGIELSCLQFLTAGLIGTAIAVITEHPTFSGMLAGIIPLAYTGIFSSGVAYTLQVIGQKNLEPAVASLILSLESVISVLAGWVLLHQKLSGRELLGCLLVFAAVILVQLPERQRKQPEGQRE